MRLIHTLLRRLRAALAREDGVVLLYALGAMVIVLAASATAIAAVDNDLPLTSNDTYQKQAYAAAQAGIQHYLFELNANGNYWEQCTNGANWLFNNGSSVTPQPVPGSAGQTEDYAVTLLPAAGQSTYSQCDTTDPTRSMIQSTGTGAGTLRISSTGYAFPRGGSYSSPQTVRRTIVASILHQGFANFVYFTNYETSDPQLQVDDAYYDDGDPSIEPPSQCGGGNCGSNYSAAALGASQQCSQYLWQGRNSDNNTTNPSYGAGNFFSDNNRSLQCDEIQFADQDHINGPFHTNDEAVVCGSPTFGRSGRSDPISFGTNQGNPPGVDQVGGAGCGGSPTFNGPVTQYSNAQLPTTNTLASVATSNYDYSGTTCLTLGATTITVAHPTGSQSCVSGSLSTTTQSYPSNGVIYDQTGATGCSLTYDVDDPSYSCNTGCGTIYVSGCTGSPLTIGADNDIVIDGSISCSSGTNALLGLVALNFVRVFHPVSNTQNGGASTWTACTQNGGNDNGAGSLTNPTIYASILSLKHSFVVDNYACGPSLQDLNIVGSIGQNFRGTVATSNGDGSIASGYTKNYTYNDTLQYSTPPDFPSPTNGAWKIERQVECQVAATCDATS